MQEKANLQLEINELKEQTDEMARTIKNNDVNESNKIHEYVDYIEDLEDELEDKIEELKVKDAKISNDQQLIDELREQIQRLKSFTQKRQVLEIANPFEQSDEQLPSKRQKMDIAAAIGDQNPNAQEDKENFVQQLIRRSSCYIGGKLGFNGQQMQKQANPNQNQNTQVRS